MTNRSAVNKLRYDLTGRAALVTGASSGIGLATVAMLARNGCAVALNHLADDPRGPEQVAKLRAEGLNVIAAPGDVGVAGMCEKMVEDACQKLGRLDLLAANAGTPGVRQVVPPSRLDLMTEELWRTLIEVNLLGVFRSVKAAAPALKAAHGAIVCTASIAGVTSPGSSLAYGATKAGVISLTRNLARGLAPEVRVNAIAPGSVTSGWQIEWGAERLAQSVEKSALKRRSEPDDLAEVIVFFGFGASMVTGQTLVVDGGLTL
jgi:3-oxoacyl-[acyl-carrier protein] reductase